MHEINFKSFHSFLLIKLVKHITALADSSLKGKATISYQTFVLLILTHNFKEISQRELSHCLGFSEAGVSKQIEILRQKGLLTREEKTDNRREHSVLLTKAGVQALKQARKEFLKKEEEIFGVLTKEEQQILSRLLTKLMKYFDFDEF